MAASEPAGDMVEPAVASETAGGMVEPETVAEVFAVTAVSVDALPATAALPSPSLSSSET